MNNATRARMKRVMTAKKVTLYQLVIIIAIKLHGLLAGNKSG